MRKGKRTRALRNMNKDRERDGVFITYTNNQVFIVALAPNQANSESPARQQKQMYCCYCISISSGRLTSQFPRSPLRSHIQTHTNNACKVGECGKLVAGDAI